MTIGKPAALLILLASLAVFAQDKPADSPQAPPATTQGAPATTPDATSSPATPPKTDRAAAYYHYSLAHMYEELVAIYGRAEFATKAIEEYKLAINNDPSSEYLNSGLAELYARTGHIRDAVMEAQDVIKRDPQNLEARKLLGRIYLRSLGDQGGAQSQEILKRAIEQYQQIVRLEPKSVEDHLLLGRLYRLNNDLLKAEAEFKTAVQIEPTSEDALTTLAYLYNEEGDSKRAAETLNQVPEAARTSKMYSALGYTYEQEKDYKKAVEAYRSAVNSDKDNLDASRGLAQNLLNDNQQDAALEQFRQIVEADPHDAQSLMRMAEIYRREGKFDQALDALKRAENEVQDSLEVPYNIAVIYQAQGRFDDAINELNQLLQKSEKPDGSYTAGEKNNRSVFLERLGSIYRDTGRTQQAIDTFRKMLTLGDEPMSRGYQQMVETYRDAKEFSQATAIAQEAANKLPNDRNVKMMLAGQLADSGQPDAGINMAKSLLKNDGSSDDREVWLTLANIYSRLRRFPDAENAIDSAEKLATRQEDKDYVLFMAGSIYERQKKYDQAEDVFKKVLANDPNNAVALNYLGYMMADRGLHLDEALGYLKRAVQIDPYNGAYLDSIGWAYYKLGNYDLAEENLRKASERTANDPTVLDHLGDLYQKTDRLKLAAAYWERALQEFARSNAGDVDTTEVAKVQKKLETAKVKLAKQGERKAAEVQPK